MEKTEGKTLCPQSHGVDDVGHHREQHVHVLWLGPHVPQAQQTVYDGARAGMQWDQRVRQHPELCQKAQRTAHLGMELRGEAASHYGIRPPHHPDEEPWKYQPGLPGANATPCPIHQKEEGTGQAQKEGLGRGVLHEVDLVLWHWMRSLNIQPTDLSTHYKGQDRTPGAAPRKLSPPTQSNR